ncbi:hypothetical protein LOK49_LG07G01105 [Camellia lanceoleosa]|uniref:Uncharacterized protein n=1 Tax=Camellia lanceoleosa TaxID=1840588 RepID=A0ACC0H128_9ERIC|nr:hypothetical protein LOK49_LG07G01105 [Camellia lanceoleosa]
MIEAQIPSRSVLTGPDQSNLGLKHKDQSARPVENMANLGSSSELAMDNRREEIRQGKKESCTTTTSFQKSEQEVRGSMSSIPFPNSPKTFQQVKETPKTKFREPPDRNGGRRRQLSNREAHFERA